MTLENTPEVGQLISQDTLCFIQSIKHRIISSWHAQIRQTLQLDISDEALLGWLSTCLDAFSGVIECEENKENCVFSEFTLAAQEAGATLNDAIEALNLLRDAVADLDLSNTTGADGFRYLPGECAAAQLKTWARQVTTANTAAYIEHTSRSLNRQQDRISSLLRVAQAASSSLALDEVLRVISEEVIRVLNAFGCNAFLFPDRSKYGNYYLIEPLPPADYHVPDPPDRFTMEALIRKEPVISYDVMQDPRTDKRTMKYFGLKSAMAFPFVFQNRAVAAGFVAMVEHHHFTQDEIDLVMGIANSGAVAVENARLHEMSIQLAIAQERNRLAQEMHDHFAQALAVTKLHLNSLLLDDLNSDSREKVVEAKEVVEETYVELRDTIFGLRAINELDVHFLDNFKGYLRTFGIHNQLDIQMTVTEADISLLSGEALQQVSRIIEESLNNIRKHAKASRVLINGGRTGAAVWITIEDDGIGIVKGRSDRSDEGHFGIPIMKERAQSVGGSVEISQRASGGTCVRLEIPYR